MAFEKRAESVQGPSIANSDCHIVDVGLELRIRKQVRGQHKAIGSLGKFGSIICRDRLWQGTIGRIESGLNVFHSCLHVEVCQLITLSKRNVELTLCVGRSAT